MHTFSQWFTATLAFCFLVAGPLNLQGQATYKVAYPNLSFTQPVDYQVTPDQGNDVYVVEQGGRIHVFDNDTTVSSTDTFLDIRSRVLSDGYEEGLLGMAFHPEYPDSNYFYVNYTADNSRRTVISRFEVNPEDSRDAMEQSEEVIMEVSQPYANHNGGKLTFGPDQYLYIGFGDGGSGGDPLENGQDRSTILGSLSRIDIDTSTTTRNYGIPSGNPFVGADCGPEGCREEIYAYGLRNPWRFSFDPANGRLWLADVGQSSYEEVNVVEKGENYGWNIMEGTHCYDPSSGCDQTGLTLPVWEYSHDVGGSITGGVVYRGSEIDELTGQYLVADFVDGKAWALQYDGEEVTGDQKLFDIPRVAAFGTDRSGEVYMCSFDGNIYRLVSDSGTGIPGKGETPNQFRLYSNYPNPFNPTTHFEFALPESREVTLRIYDTGGRLVQEKQLGRMQAGLQTVAFNADQLSSGVYMYEIQAGEEVHSQNMTLLK